MATRLLSLQQKLLIYHRYSFKSFSIWLRNFSSQNRGSSESSERPANPAKVKAGAEPASKWLNIRAGIFGPDDDRLPLPGDVGLSQHLETLQEEEQKFNAVITSLSQEKHSLETMEEPFIHFNNSNQILTSQERQLEVIKRVQMFSKAAENLPSPNVEEVLECRVQECPDLLKKDFQTLFPNINLSKQRMTVVSLCQKTKHDMSFWSEEVEVEREELVDHFVDCARKICNAIRSEGYWADFIDPTSGRPFLGPFTNATFFETDERYRQLGFTIDDLGCCKVISHRTWGSRIFVGALFTSAPVNSEVIEDALSMYKITGNT